MVIPAPQAERNLPDLRHFVDHGITNIGQNNQLSAFHENFFPPFERLGAQINAVRIWAAIHPKHESGTAL